MRIEELYRDCQEQLKALGVELRPSNEGGFRGHYRGRYMMRLRNPGRQYFTINLKKANDTLIGRQRIYDEKTLQNFFKDYLKLRIKELEEQGY